jgi:hypothetical protein
MKEYKFKVYKQVEIIIPALDQEAAWVEISKVDPNLLGLEWAVDLVSSPDILVKAKADDPEYIPEEEDPLFSEWDDLSYLNPNLRGQQPG